MDCPRCQVPLTMSDRQGVEIDYCPKCRGVWLDRGELDKIIERSAHFVAEPATPPVIPSPPPPGQIPPYARQDDRWAHSHGHGGHYPKHKRKKSFLEEVFDF